MENETKIGDEVKTESRRKFLKTAGKFAVYTPPALMMMSNANATYVKDSTGHQGHKKKYHGHYKKKHHGQYKKKYSHKKRDGFLRRWFS